MLGCEDFVEIEVPILNYPVVGFEDVRTAEAVLVSGLHKNAQQYLSNRRRSGITYFW
jgi:hypothetical protein